MKSDKQRILEAYSEDLKAMNTNPENNTSNVKKWIVKKPTYITEQHNIVDAYALLAENDNMRQNKMRILNDQILHEAKLSRLKEVIEEADADMKRYEEGAALANAVRFVEARDKFDEATALYRTVTEDHDEDDGHDHDDEEEMDEGEGLKPAPSPEKHDATGSTEGGDTTVGNIETSEIDDELDTVTEAKAKKAKYKEDMDKAKMDMDDYDDDSEEMKEVMKTYKEAKKKYKEACADEDDMMDEADDKEEDEDEEVIDEADDNEDEEEDEEDEEEMEEGMPNAGDPAHIDGSDLHKTKV